MVNKIQTVGTAKGITPQKGTSNSADDAIEDKALNMLNQFPPDSQMYKMQMKHLVDM